jgi:hypothetical protein
MINGFEILPGQDIGELFLDDDDYMAMCNRLNNTYPNGVQLGSILSTPDEPELHVLAEAQF